MGRPIPAMVMALCLAPRLASAAESVPVGAILDRAAERALAYEAAALKWACDETLRQARYRGHGEASGGSQRELTLLMGRDAAGWGAVELRAPRSSVGPPSARQPAAMDGFPPVTVWLRLFHPAVRGFMSVRDRGENGPAGGPGHAFASRGAIPYVHGDDVREWEGTAWVDPITGDLLEIEAVPSSQNERLAWARDRRNRRSVGFSFFGWRPFRIGPKANGRRVEISFGDHDGFWLPYMSRLETFESVDPTTTHPLRVVLDWIDACRRFETSATPSEALPKRE